MIDMIVVSLGSYYRFKRLVKVGVFCRFLNSVDLIRAEKRPSVHRGNESADRMIGLRSSLLKEGNVQIKVEGGDQKEGAEAGINKSQYVCFQTFDF